MAQKKSRGDRNNNPGNIRKSDDKWQGLATSQPDEEFATFKDPTYGIRAMARLLIRYQDDYGLNTVAKIINRWAPPVGDRNGSAPGGGYTQNTTGYAQQVADAAAVTVNKKIDLHKFNDLFPIIKAMIKHENGYQPYTDAQITKGLVLAGVEPDKKPLIKDKEVVGATSVGGLTAVSLMAQYSEQAAPVLSTANTLAETAPYVLGGLVLIITALIVWKIIMDKKKGLR